MKFNHLKCCTLKNKIHSTYLLSSNDCMESFQQFIDKLKEKKIKTERTYTTISSISSKNKSSKSTITIKANTVSNRIEAKRRPISIKNYRRGDVNKKESLVNRSYQSNNNNTPTPTLRDYVGKGAQKKKHRKNNSGSQFKKKEIMNYDKCKYTI